MSTDANTTDSTITGQQPPQPQQFLTITDDAWAQAEADLILAHARIPEFPDHEVKITAYGAVNDGRTDSTTAIARAIEDCARIGGGRVVVPAGTFLTGAIHLQSNIELHISRGATLLFSQDPEQYLPVVYTRFEGTELMNYSPFIYARGAENVAITGAGTLDGQADNNHWWPWKGKTEYGWQEGDPNQLDDADRLVEMADNGVPVSERVFGAGHYLRPNFIQFYQCRNVLIEGVTMRRSPMWEVHPVLCRNVRIRGLRIDSHGPNNDGCDPESCRYVVIENCTFDTGDDCIAIKAGKNTDGRRVNVPCQDILIQQCEMADGHGGITIGSEMTGGVRNVLARDCTLSSPNLDMAFRFKTNSVRGGVIENVRMQNVSVGQVAEAFMRINFRYGEGNTGAYSPLVRNIDVRHVTVEQSGDYAFDLQGFDNDVIRNVTISDSIFRQANEPWQIVDADVVLDNVVINDTHHDHRILNQEDT